MIAAWWAAQSERDRRVLIIGAAIVAIALAWAFLWHPLALRQAELSVQLDQARRDLAFVRVSAAEVERLRNAGVRSRADRQGKSLLALADLSARGAGLEAALKRLEPVGSNSVRANFEFASFDTLAGWIEGLSRDYGIQVSDLSVDRLDANGIVNARVTLEDVP